MRDPLQIADIAVMLNRYWDQHYQGQRPTIKQRTILADRSIPVPVTRRDASRLIATIAQVEGWHDAPAD